MATKRLGEEKLSSTNISYVISLLEKEKPITKKDACSILNISYNVTRLDTILRKHKEKIERDAKRRAEKRGKPLDPDELVYIIQAYLQGDTIDSISDNTYRGPSLIKSVLEKYAVPIRARPHHYFKPELIPEGAARDRFKIGEIVYSARYDSLAKIYTEHKVDTQWVYRVWLQSESQQQFAYQEAAELASLEHLIALGVKL